MSEEREPTFEDVQKMFNLNTLDFEGGYFNEIYKCKINAELPGHSCGTSIYYALHGKKVSRWHRVEVDEIWHYEAGTAAKQILLFEDGHFEVRIIGGKILQGERPQSIIPAGTWQAASLVDQSEDKWGLFGATCFPGFEYSDTSVKKAEELIDKWPEAEQAIKEANLWL